jgi:hypothetical protein
MIGRGSLQWPQSRPSRQARTKWSVSCRCAPYRADAPPPLGLLCAHDHGPRRISTLQRFVGKPTVIRDALERVVDRRARRRGRAPDGERPVSERERSHGEGRTVPPKKSRVNTGGDSNHWTRGGAKPQLVGRNKRSALRLHRFGGAIKRLRPTVTSIARSSRAMTAIGRRVSLKTCSSA